jgi:hypothetical protein
VRKWIGKRGCKKIEKENERRKVEKLRNEI